MTNQTTKATQVPTLSPANQMKDLMSNQAMMSLFSQSLGENANNFVTSLIELYSDPEGTLKECEAKEVAMEALKAATLKLPINKGLGFAYIVPYNKNKKADGKWIKEPHPQFQIGYKGYVQLAMRTGQYKTIHAGVVYEGMQVEENYLTGEVQITGQKTSDKPIGYFAYFRLINGFEKTVYWSVERVKEHAAKFSQTYKTMENAKKKDYYNADKYVWDAHFDEMAMKTLVRRLLAKYGVLSTEMQQAEMSDVDDRMSLEIQEQANQEEFRTMAIQESIDPETGEIQEPKKSDDDFLGSDFAPIDFNDKTKAPF